MIEAGIVVAVNVLTALVKKYVYPKYGRTGVQVVVFVLAVIGAVYMRYGASVEAYATAAIAIFTTAIALYEVLWSRIAFFKGK